MLNKKLVNIFLFFILNINLFAHKIPSVDISLTYLENDSRLMLDDFRMKNVQTQGKLKFD